MGDRSAAGWIAPPFLMALLLSSWIDCPFWLPLTVATLGVAVTTIGASFGRLSAKSDSVFLLTVAALGFSFGQSRGPPAEVPVSTPEILVHAHIGDDRGRRVAKDVRFHARGEWQRLPGRFLCTGDSGAVGEIVAAAWIAPLTEPRLPGRVDPALRDRADGLRGKVILRRCWSQDERAVPATTKRREEIQHRLDARLGRILSPSSRAIAARIVWGVRQPLDPDLAETFRVTGTMHLLAISGMHLSLVVLMLEFVLRQLIRKRAARMVFVVALLFGYAFVVGPHPSVIRSTAMAGVVLMGRAYDHGRVAGSAYWWALVLMATVFPGSLVSAGGQLSFAACGAMILAPRVQGIWSLPVASLMATAATSGIVLSHFGTVAPFAVIANLAGVPMLLPILVSILWGLLWGNPAPALLQSIAWGPAQLLTESWIDLLGAMEPAGTATLVRLPSGLWSGLCASGLFLLCLLVASSISNRTASWAVRILGLPLLLLVIWLPSQLCRRIEPFPRAIVLPVGQGDATLLRPGPSVAYLIDTGPGGPDGRRGQRHLAPALRWFGVARLDAVFLTHGDEDHVGGLRGLLVAGIEIDTLFLSQADSYKLRLPRRKMPIVQTIARGWARRAGRLDISLLAPEPGPQRALGNEGSMVLRVEGPNGAFLLPGDLEGPAELHLATQPALAGAEVQLAGHHGSNGSTREAWLDRVSPRFVLVSCGARNRHGHPAPEFLERLKRRKIDVRRTDRDGCLYLRWDRDTLWFSSDGCPTPKPVL